VRARGVQSEGKVRVGVGQGECEDRGRVNKGAAHS
jgi:hypothetical protein